MPQWATGEASWSRYLLHPLFYQQVPGPLQLCWLEATNRAAAPRPEDCNRPLPVCAIVSLAIGNELQYDLKRNDQFPIISSLIEHTETDDTVCE